MERLGLGWYLNWRVQPDAYRSPQVDYMPMIRLRGANIVPDGETLRAAVRAMPGALWLVGNEPDVKWQDNVTPEEYAVAYHHVYTLLKDEDPTCQVAIGGVVQPTPVRRQYLDMILDAYQDQYGQRMPIDVWNVHAYVFPEGSTGWGCRIPPDTDESLAMHYSLQDQDNVEIWKENLVAMRAWMRDRGYRDRPLVITEYGIILPETYGYDAARVRDFMLATFDWLTTATDAETGYPADGNRLVQAWAWFALDIPTSFGQPSWYHLFDPDSRTIMPLGEAYGAYAAPLTAPVPGRVDLQPRSVRLTGTEVEAGGRLRAVVTAEVHNGGGSRAEDVLVRFERNGVGAGEVTIPAIAAGASAQGTVVWSGLVPGTYDVRVEVAPDGQVSECDPFDNSLTVRLAIGSSSASPLRKLSDNSRAAVGDPVRFTIVVTNPPEEDDGETWYELLVTDEIHPSLRIDDVTVAPVADAVAVDDNTVEISVESLAPEASFAITIDCTLTGPVVPGQVIGNTATLAYEDEGGNPQPAEEVEEPPEILVVSRVFFPVVLK